MTTETVADSELRNGNFDVWKTIKLGAGIKRDVDFCGDYNIEGGVKEFLAQSNFEAREAETKVDLVVVSGIDLGFRDGEGTRLADIYKRANEFGLDLCSVEVGLQLRQQYKDQPRGEMLHIAMESATGLLCVERTSYGKLGLCVSNVNSDSFWPVSNLLVFLRRK